MRTMAFLSRTCDVMMFVIFLALCYLTNGQTTEMSPNNNASLGVNSSMTSPVTEASVQPSGTTCRLVSDKSSDDLQEALLVGYNMLVLLFSFSNTSQEVPITPDTPQPLTWFHVSGNHGKGLLWLRQDFGMLSLTSLNYGISSMNIQLSDSPEGCSSEMSAAEITASVQDLILNNLISDRIANISWIGNEICNARFRVFDTGTEIYFTCCNKDKQFNTTSYELQRSTWMNIFLLGILILPCIALMFAPLLIPFGLFRDDISDVFFQHKINSKLQIHVTKDPNGDAKTTEKQPINISKEYCKDMPKFCSTLSTLNNNITYDCTLEKIYFYVDKDNLIGKDTDPSGPFTMLYDRLTQYQQRRRSFKGVASLREFLRVLLGKILNIVNLIIIITLVNIPVIIKSVFYVVQTVPEWYIFNSLERLNLNSNILQYGSFGKRIEWRDWMYLAYVTLIGLLVLVQFFKIQGTYQTNVVIDILKQCLRDSRKRRMSFAFHTIYKACHSIVTSRSILGRLFIPVFFVLFLPFAIFTLLFYIFPTINLTFSIPLYLSTFVLSNKCGCLSRSGGVRTTVEHLSKWLGLNQIFFNQVDTDEDQDEDDDQICSPADIFLIIILVCSIPVVIFVVLDCTAFYIDMGIYVLIGLLLNASFTTTYVIVFLMLLFYIRDLFNDVANRYLEFNTTIIKEAIEKTRDDVVRVSLLNENFQKNTAFQLQNETPSGDDNLPRDDIKLSFEDGALVWRTKRLILFLDRRDTPYIPPNFFKKTSVMECAGTPGPTAENLRSVLISIARIFFFLFLIILIASAFAEETSTLATNQTLTVIAGGLLPWLFRTMLKAPKTEGIDVNNLHFQEVFNNVIASYEETWTVADIEVTSIQVSENQSLNGSRRSKSRASHETTGNNMADTTDEHTSTKTLETTLSEGENSSETINECEIEKTSVLENNIEENHLIILVKKKSSQSVVGVVL
ncbi:uncharacterized protein [Argopecten irradians]|uniref:uncharacterized protein n=1 Tax=Argopecten irradians TaxID=31199 RepID=UPI0037133505